MEEITKMLDIIKSLMNKVEKLEEHNESLQLEITNLEDENAKLIARLEISPQGDDKIDELESALAYHKYQDEKDCDWD